MNDVPFYGRHYRVILLGNDGKGGTTYGVISKRTNDVIMRSTLAICNAVARGNEDCKNRRLHGPIE